jgi:hypothetical protein
MTYVDTQPSWLGTAPTQAWADVIAAAQYAAHDDAARCCASIADSSVHRGWLVICAVKLLAAAIRDGLDAQEMRGEVLSISATHDVPGYSVSAFVECALMAEAVLEGDLSALRALDDASQICAVDLAYCAAALFGHFAACQDDHAEVFAALRRHYGLGAA